MENLRALPLQSAEAYPTRLSTNTGRTGALVWVLRYLLGNALEVLVERLQPGG
jgi:hypothetical protein